MADTIVTFVVVERSSLDNRAYARFLSFKRRYRISNMSRNRVDGVSTAVSHRDVRAKKHSRIRPDIRVARARKKRHNFRRHPSFSSLHAETRWWRKSFLTVAQTDDAQRESRGRPLGKRCSGGKIAKGLALANRSELHGRALLRSRERERERERESARGVKGDDSAKKNYVTRRTATRSATRFPRRERVRDSVSRLEELERNGGCESESPLSAMEKLTFFGCERNDNDGIALAPASRNFSFCRSIESRSETDRPPSDPPNQSKRIVSRRIVSRGRGNRVLLSRPFYMAVVAPIANIMGRNLTTANLHRESSPIFIRFDALVSMFLLLFLLINRHCHRRHWRCIREKYPLTPL